MHEPANYRCPFCEIQKVSEAGSEILLQSAHSVCFLGLQGNKGSGPTLLVASKEHFENLYELPDDILHDAFCLAKKVAITMKSCFDVDGTSILQHNEPAGNQEVWHFHLHVKGRILGDELYAKSRYALTSKERDGIARRFRGCL